MDKKMAAKKAALMGMSSKLRDEARKPMAEDLKSKKMQKITIMAPDEEGLKKGLSKAEQILKAKFGAMGLEDEDMEMIDESMEHEDCPMCENQGCEACSEEELLEE
jgi:hypothetical protein